jgi:hypothetical protein
LVPVLVPEIVFPPVRGVHPPLALLGEIMEDDWFDEEDPEMSGVEIIGAPQPPKQQSEKK